MTLRSFLCTVSPPLAVCLALTPASAFAQAATAAPFAQEIFGDNRIPVPIHGGAAGRFFKDNRHATGILLQVASEDGQELYHLENVARWKREKLLLSGLLDFAVIHGGVDSFRDAIAVLYPDRLEVLGAAADDKTFESKGILDNPAWTGIERLWCQPLADGTLELFGLDLDTRWISRVHWDPTTSTFIDPSSFRGPAGVFELCTVDLDPALPGREIAMLTSNGLLLVVGESGGPFVMANTQIQDSTGPGQLAASQVAGGGPEVLLRRYVRSDGKPAVMGFQGKGSTPAWTQASHLMGSAITSADWDGDGSDDLLLGGPDFTAIFLRGPGGSSSFSSPQAVLDLPNGNYFSLATPRLLVSADADDDGDPDLYAFSAEQALCHVVTNSTVPRNAPLLEIVPGSTEVHPGTKGNPDAIWTDLVVSLEAGTPPPALATHVRIEAWLRRQFDSPLDSKSIAAHDITLPASLQGGEVLPTASLKIDVEDLVELKEEFGILWMLSYVRLGPSSQLEHAYPSRVLRYSKDPVGVDIDRDRAAIETTGSLAPNGLSGSSGDEATGGSRGDGSASGTTGG